jgi:Lectin C-type domain
MARFAVMIGLLGGLFGWLLGGCAFEGSPVSVDGRMPDAIPDAPPDAAVIRCATYEVVANAPVTSRYRRLTAAKTAAEQAAECSRDGTHLIVLDSVAEVAAMQSYAPTRNGYYTVGLSDAASEGTWVTAKMTAASFLPWAGAQPDGGTLQNCVVSSAGVLYDYYCNVQWPSVCECD